MGKTRCVARATKRRQDGDDAQRFYTSERLLAWERAVKEAVHLVGLFDQRRRACRVTPYGEVRAVVQERLEPAVTRSDDLLTVASLKEDHVFFDTRQGDAHGFVTA